MVQADNSNSEIDFEYDTLSRLVSETQNPGGGGKTIEYTYADDGSRASCEYFSGFDLDYTVDAVGRWTKIEASVLECTRSCL